jgi:4-hydroxy-3-polyprenylbenzoate decarboxylase
MAKKDVTNLRGAIEYYKELGEILVTNVETDPELEVSGIQKHFDGGAAILFEKLKGYSNQRIVTNMYASRERIAKLFDVDDHKKFKFKVADAVLHPTPPKVVNDAPCQEVVITKDIDVYSVVPVIKQTPRDPLRTLGGGNTFISGKYFWGGTHVSYNRMSFRGKDYSSFQISPGSHTDMVVKEWHGKGPIPFTINMGVPPAVTMMAGGGFLYMFLHKGCDELGVSGSIQGSPIEIVKARTQDAYAIAQAEYVIEGYLDTTQHVWETPEAEEKKTQGVYPFHPEWPGYYGRAYRTYKFQATAITHRKDRPIYYPTITHSIDDHNIDTRTREANFWLLAESICPGICIDTYIPKAFGDWGGVIFQFKKRMAREEGYQKNILTAALSASMGMRIAIAVDEDINMYEPEDVLWAITTRAEPDEDFQVVAPGSRGQVFQPAQRARITEKGQQWVASAIKYAGGLAIDATAPFDVKWAFDRPQHHRVDLKKWFTDQQIEKAKASMWPYHRFLSESGI